ncbi:MAG: T9SS type A sorting domain-containing protein [Bacteroidales bacterium]|nr:T9SS type A sorting domain-containing protein [Bacteroidales bacterium]
MKPDSHTKILGLVILLSLIFQANITHSQAVNDFGFKEKHSIIVCKKDGTVYKQGWAGGLNNVQIQSIRLNDDTFEDLIVFDRHGNRLLSYINDGIEGEISYTYAPEYESCFPDITNWMILRDFNCDGKKDLFTHTTGGILLYKNTGIDRPKFTLEVEPYITSLQGAYPTNILVTDVDYPIIEDMDNDGDLDIIVFFGLGSFMEYHQNMSVEKYMHCDSAIYEKTSNCWGNFAESDESNELILNACSGSMIIQPKEGEKHTGSTMMSLDINGDQAMDLILGDIDYPTLVQLINGGTSEQADMISYNWNFPTAEHPVNLFSFPLATAIDINNDQKQDIIVSPFDPSQNTPKSQNYNNIWLYECISSENNTQFKFIDSAFLQSEMIDLGSGAMPCLYDYDQDGLTDLFASNYGMWDTSYYDQGILRTKYISSIALYRNIGTTKTPEFILITDDLGDLSKKGYRNLHLSIASINQDEYADIIIGTESGNLMLGILNNEDPQNPSLEIVNDNYLSIESSYVTPQFFDLNNDGLFDIVTGDRTGNLHYFKNTGSAQLAEYSYITNQLGGVDVTDTDLSYFGYSIPFFYRKNNETVLLVGSEYGHIYYYKDIDSDPEYGTYTLENSNLLSIDKGSRSSICLSNLNNDEYPEMIYGNYSGGLHYFEGSKPSSVGFPEPKQTSNSIRMHPNPANENIQIVLNENINTPLIYEIRNTTGLCIQKGRLMSKTNQIAIDKLNPGVYFIAISNKSERIASKKLIVVK